MKLLPQAESTFKQGEGTHSPSRRTLPPPGDHCWLPRRLGNSSVLALGMDRTRALPGGGGWAPRGASGPQVRGTC